MKLHLIIALVLMKIPVSIVMRGEELLENAKKLPVLGRIADKRIALRFFVFRFCALRARNRVA